jgi:hypothetical protein
MNAVDVLLLLLVAAGAVLRRGCTHQHARRRHHIRVDS